MATKNAIGSGKPIEVSYGGTGASSLTDAGVLVGSGTGAITALAAASDGQLIIGSTGSDPAVAALTAGAAISITNGAGTITIDNKLAINAQTGTTYTLVLSDAGKMVTLTNASAITLTIPTNASVAFPIGTQILLYAGGAGQVTLSSTATMRSADNAYKLSKQYSVCSIVKIATDEWVLGGDLTT